RVIAWRVNRYLRTLRWTLADDADVAFVDTRSFEGMEIYRRTLSFILVVVCRKILGESLLVRHSISDGYYCEIASGPVGEETVGRLRQAMEDLIAADWPIERVVLPLDRARTLFERQGNDDKASLLRWAAIDPIEIYRMDGISGFYYAPLAPSTGFVDVFDLVAYEEGMVLRFPTVASPKVLPPFQVPRKLTGVFREYSRWTEVLGVGTAESLHRLVAEGECQELILVSEALHAQRFSRLADEIAGREEVRLVSIAGPSGSGKTTSAHRLRIQLRVCGLCPVTLSLDDYFVDRAHTPRDKEGNYDFEALEALDLDLINEQLESLLAGREVSVPRFDFLTGRRTSGPTLRLGPGDILIIEGIHGLNGRLTEAIPKERKFLIYVSCLTGVNFDRHNRTSTTDNRLLRRLVRDHRLRGKSPEATLAQWPSVIRGAQKHIFPYQEGAQVMFNSALPYELSVLKGYVEPLLRSVSDESPSYGEAQRLLAMLRFMPLIRSQEVPNLSILREFIGGGCFDL
ncbi:MAG: nucleoside kinase, partial [Synergistales bacterium]|nr:nucleoside kinase [Synergistales bacterium]